MINYKSLFNIVLLVLRPFIKANFGNWGKWQHCAQGEYVTGMKVKSEKFQGNAFMSWIHHLGEGNILRDDSGINAIRLKCSDGKELISAEGVEGEWSHWVNVDEGKKLVVVEVRSMIPCGSCGFFGGGSDCDCDDVATSEIQFKHCRDLKYCKSYSLRGYWGVQGCWWIKPAHSWLPECDPKYGYDFEGYWSTTSCPQGTAITGFRAQVQGDQGGGDDTGLNRLEFKCS